MGKSQITTSKSDRLSHLHKNNFVGQESYRTPPGHEYLFEAINLTDNAIICKDLEGRITLWNKGAEQLYGYREKDVLGLAAEVLEPEEVKGETLSIIAKIVNKKEVKRYETVRLTKSRKLVHVELTVSPIKDVHGNIAGIIAVAKDITGKRRLEKQVKEYGDNLRRLFGLLTYQKKILAKSSPEEIIRSIDKVAKDIFLGAERLFFAPNSTSTDLVTLSKASLPPTINRRSIGSFLQWMTSLDHAVVYSGNDHRSTSTPFDELLKIYHMWHAFPLFFEKQCFAYYVIAFHQSKKISSVDSEFFYNLLDLVSGPIWHALRFEEHLSDPKAYAPNRFSFLSLVGQSREMQQIYNLIQDIAATTATVLITGENGTGKQLVAQSIHALSPRRDGPFIIANCSAYPSSLIESELFGHEKGAFTGAIKRKLGRFDLAQEGTIFLDEIGEVPLTTQVSLLRVLQDKCFERVGGEKTIIADVRIIAATNKNLKEEMAAGNFREDLFYRLNVISIDLPPLRQRKEDIVPLCSHFLAKYNEREGKDIQDFDPKVIQLFLDHDWPGNVRELQNAVELAVILTKGNTIKEKCLPPHLRETYIYPSTSLAENEKKLIARVLDESNWNKHEAARRLGITRSTLYSKVKRYKLEMIL
ncbi:MAG TPA: sigma-54-dependent Fis family transcriptional regulator [Proteobacteria bacterium]|nr:sigma-54-dependent Fis family transcriptional regulator [Pseudomonadota bacterium]